MISCQKTLGSKGFCHFCLKWLFEWYFSLENDIFLFKKNKLSYRIVLKALKCPRIKGELLKLIGPKITDSSKRFIKRDFGALFYVSDSRWLFILSVCCMSWRVVNKFMLQYHLYLSSGNLSALVNFRFVSKLVRKTQLDSLLLPGKHWLKVILER